MGVGPHHQLLVALRESGPTAHARRWGAGGAEQRAVKPEQPEQARCPDLAANQAGTAEHAGHAEHCARSLSSATVRLPFLRPFPGSLPGPPGRDLPHGALRALTADEKLCSLPQYRKHAAKLTPEQVGPAGRADPTGGSPSARR